MITCNIYRECLFWYKISDTQKEDFIGLIEKILKIRKPNLVLVDQYSALKGKKFREFLREKNIEIETICSNIPSSNGMVERVISTLIDSLRCNFCEKKKSWKEIVEITIKKLQ